MKAGEFSSVVTSGRTHLMDAVPVTIGQRFGGYAAQVRQGSARVRDTLPRLGQIPLGGTATGTGLNTHPEFAARVRAMLSEETGLVISPPADPFEAQAARDGLVEASGALKVVAVSLTKIANDLRLQGSGPRAGLSELFLPELQKGSSIMPGKVNPVLPEVVTQVAAQVIGNDAAITVGGLGGHFELNVYIPLMARNLLQSIGAALERVAAAGRQVRRRDRGQRRAVRALRRADAVGGHGAQPVHRLRQGVGDRRRRPPRRVARFATSHARPAWRTACSTRRSISTRWRTPHALMPLVNEGVALRLICV